MSDDELRSSTDGREILVSCPERQAGWSVREVLAEAVRNLHVDADKFSWYRDELRRLQREVDTMRDTNESLRKSLTEIRSAGYDQGSDSKRARLDHTAGYGMPSMMPNPYMYAPSQMAPMPYGYPNMAAAPVPLPSYPPQPAPRRDDYARDYDGTRDDQGRAGDRDRDYGHARDYTHRDRDYGYGTQDAEPVRDRDTRRDDGQRSRQQYTDPYATDKTTYDRYHRDGQ